MGSSTSSNLRSRGLNSSKGAVALFLTVAAALLIAREGSAEQRPGDVNAQGGWAYIERSKDGEVEHLATTRAAEDAVWLTLGCSADGRLTVSFVHSEQFPFPLKPVFLLKLHSGNVPTALFEAKSVPSNQMIFVAPLLMRHLMPVLMQEDEIVVSIPERDGIGHDYTFSMQPNDFALRPIRSCFDF